MALPSGGVWTVRAVATAARQVMTIELLYQMIGVNLNYTTKAGRTALLVAVNKDLLDVVDRLIDLGCEVNQENDHGQTPLLVRTCPRRCARRVCGWSRSTSAYLNPLPERGWAGGAGGGGQRPAGDDAAACVQGGAHRPGEPSGRHGTARGDTHQPDSHHVHSAGRRRRRQHGDTRGPHSPHPGANRPFMSAYMCAAVHAPPYRPERRIRVRENHARVWMRRRRWAGASTRRCCW